jgi:hypothetical protein
MVSSIQLASLTYASVLAGLPEVNPTLRLEYLVSFHLVSRLRYISLKFQMSSCARGDISSGQNPPCSHIVGGLVPFCM